MYINVTYLGVDSSLFEPFVFGCYKEGKEAGLLRGGDAAKWSLPLREVLYEKEGLRLCTEWFSQVLDEEGITQVAFLGLGSAPLAGSLLLSHPSPLHIIYFRESKKDYGFCSEFEGTLDKKEPILIVDDLLNSGYACLQMVKHLQSVGIKTKNISVAVLAQFVFGEGENRLRQHGITNKIHKAMEVHSIDE